MVRRYRQRPHQTGLPWRLRGSRCRSNFGSSPAGMCWPGARVWKIVLCRAPQSAERWPRSVPCLNTCRKRTRLRITRPRGPSGLELIRMREKRRRSGTTRRVCCSLRRPTPHSTKPISRRFKSCRMQIFRRRGSTISASRGRRKVRCSG
jgi:hypothetical protein